MAVRLEERTKLLQLPFLGVHCFASSEILQRALILAQMAIHFTARHERELRGRKFDNLVHIVECAAGLTKWRPYEVTLGICVRVIRILLQPIVHDPEIALRIGSK